MLNKNDVVTLEITALTNEGSGVGHYGADENSRGMAVFVPFTAVGDVISCRIVKVMKSYAYGRLEAILTASLDRVENYCPVYGKCGGCCFRHISYEAELRAKEGFVRDAFGRIGGLYAAVKGSTDTATSCRCRFPGRTAERSAASSLSGATG